MSRSLIRLLLAVALVGGALTASTASAGPGYQQPKAGSCHQLTLRQAAFAEFVTAASVDCDKRHTSKTLIVKRLRGKVDWSQPTWAGVYESCARKTVYALGGDKLRAMSAYELTFFGPTPEDRAHGAKWRRCDLTLLGGKMLQPLPDKLRISQPLPDRYARCLAGPDRQLRVTVCAKTHTYRVTGAFRTAGAKFPGVQRLARVAIRRCPDLVSSRVWRYDIPDRAEQWRGGWRTSICYSKTTN